MQRSCRFYSKIPGFKLVYGGFRDIFTSFEIGENSFDYLNLQLFASVNDINDSKNIVKIILYSENVDKLYSYFRNDKTISKLILLENKPKIAMWGEKYFHIRDPDGHLLSFAMPIKNNK